MRLTILEAVAGDLPEILALQYLAYQSEAKLHGNPDIQPLRQTLREVESEFARGVFLKAVDGDQVIVGSVRAYSQNGTLYIGKLIVRPDLQGKGIGSRLLEAVERTAPGSRYELFTSVKSANNLRFYQRRGYKAFLEKPAAPGLSMVFLEKRGAPPQQDA